MDLLELTSVKLRQQVLERRAQQGVALFAVLSVHHAGIAGVGLEVDDVRYPNHPHFLAHAGLQGMEVGMARGGQGRKQVLQGLRLRFGWALKVAELQPDHRLRQSHGLHGLHEVIHRSGVERLQGMVAEGGDEDHGAATVDLLCHLQPR